MLTELPAELLYCLLRLLTPFDLAQVRLVCQKLRVAVDQDNVWSPFPRDPELLKLLCRGCWRRYGNWEDFHRAQVCKMCLLSPKFRKISINDCKRLMRLNDSDLDWLTFVRRAYPNERARERIPVNLNRPQTDCERLYSHFAVHRLAIQRYGSLDGLESPTNTATKVFERWKYRTQSTESDDLNAQDESEVFLEQHTKYYWIRREEHAVTKKWKTWSHDGQVTVEDERATEDLARWKALRALASEIIKQKEQSTSLSLEKCPASMRKELEFHLDAVAKATPL